MSLADTQGPRRRIYIDALALVPDRKSGIGYNLEQTLYNLLKLTDIKQRYTIYLLVPLGKARYLKKYLSQNVRIKTIYLPATVLEVFLRINLFPPMDWLLGKGIYIFPNFRNWSLWHSRSMTYVYDVGFKRFPETVNTKNRKYLSHYINRWLSRTNTVLTITEQMKEEIEKYLNIPYTKIEVVYCGVDESIFYKRSDKEVSSVKKKYDIPFDNYLLFVGNIEPRKNLQALLKAYKLLPKVIRDKYGLLIIGGDGWLNEGFYKELAAMRADSYKVLKLKDYVETEDLPALYSGAAALVHPAVYEGFGITPLEAMACETTIAVSDIPTIREVVKDSAYYFDPSDPQSISRGINEALTDKSRTETIAYDSKVVATAFTWEETAIQLMEYIEQLYSDGPERPVAKRLKSLYKHTDERIRKFLGERPLTAYRPRQTENKEQLRKIVLADFLQEQPYLMQSLALVIYQQIKHFVSVPAKKMYRLSRSLR